MSKLIAYLGGLGVTDGRFRFRVSTRQLAILEAVAVHEGANQAILGQITGIDRSTTTYLVTRLIRKGLLQRRRTAADARAYAVNLTNERRRVLQKLDPVVKPSTSMFSLLYPKPGANRFSVACDRCLKRWGSLRGNASGQARENMNRKKGFPTPNEGYSGRWLLPI